MRAVKIIPLIACLFSLVRQMYANEIQLDAFGGWMDIRGEATGAFHIESINGRALLITPDGHGFVAIGVNHLSAIKHDGESEPDLFRDRYQNDWNKFAEEVLGDFEEWGLNTVDDSVERLRRARPYFAAATFARTAKYFGQPAGGNRYHFPDVFDPIVRNQFQRQAAEYCRKHRDNPNLVAYYWTDTPTWDIHKTRRFRGTDWVSEIRALPADAPGREAYVVFLKSLYEGSVDRMNRAYDLEIQSWMDLRECDWAKIDLARYEVEKDDQAFLGVIAETYYGIIGPAMRRHDPQHMVFGEKYLLGDIPPQVVRAASKHIDAVAIQPGDGYLPIYTPGDVYPDEAIEEIHELSGKPVMICDHQISFATARYPLTIWPYHQRDGESDAASATARFMEEAFSRPYTLGYMRCQYIDRFSDRRNALKQGLFKDDGSAYDELLDAFVRGTAAAKQIVRAAASTHACSEP